MVAARPPVDLGLTSSQANLTTEQIEELPVQNLDDIVNLQAGVVDGHFRGGREGEVQYQVDGVSVNNAFDNSSTLDLDRSLLQEVQVISGTFDAEYGQAMSGVVNAVLKEGGETFEVSGEAYAGGFVFPGREDERHTSDEIHPLGTVSLQATLSGPLLGKDTTFLLSGRFYDWEDFVYGERRFNTWDRADFENNVYEGTGDGEEVPLGYSQEWSGAAQITNRSLDERQVQLPGDLQPAAGPAHELGLPVQSGRRLGAGVFRHRARPRLDPHLQCRPRSWT